MEAAGRPRFGELLRRFRLDAGLTQQGLAERSNLSVEAIGLLEREERTRPQRETVALLVRALNLSSGDESLLRSALGVAHPPRRRDRGTPSAGALTLVPARQRTSFVGRKRELAALARLLDADRVVTLVGSGGVGKTRLALHLAAGTGEAYPDGVFFVDLAPLGDERLVASALLTALDVSSTTGPAIDAAVAHLRQRRALVILDNCEHLIVAVRAVASRILEACHGVRLLSTSREALGLRGEQAFRLPSLPSHETFELFADRARSVDAAFALNAENTESVAEICRRLDGIPLAIELAAARIATLAPAQIAERLDRRFRLLTLGEPGALPRQQTMRALIDWSYDLLDTRERRCFERLAVFAGSCALDAATAVCALDDEDDLDIADLIASLVRKSLLVSEHAGDVRRYRLFESLRDYAREKLQARGDAEAAARRHAEAYVQLAERLEAHSDTMPDAAWSVQAAIERENWRAALEWAFGAQGDVALGQRLAANRKVMLRTFSPVEGRRWVRAALAVVDAATPAEIVARLEHADADGANQFGERAGALAAAQRALLRYRDLGDALGAAQAQSLAGSALALLGRTLEAEPLLREALATARALAERQLAARVLQMMAWNRSAAGDLVAARELLSEALGIAEAAGADFIATSVAASLADNAFQTGHFDEALARTADVLATLRAAGASRTDAALAATLLNMATTLVASARYAEAPAFAAEALEIARDLGLVALATLALRLLVVAALLDEGRALRSQREYACAARLFGFLDAHLSTIASGDYALHAEYERALGALRAAVGPKELGHLLLAGAGMTEEEAVTQARALR